jgi:hypothetical protein
MRCCFEDNFSGFNYLSSLTLFSQKNVYFLQAFAEKPLERADKKINAKK